MLYFIPFSIFAAPLLQRSSTPPDHNVSQSGPVYSRARRSYEQFSEHFLLPNAEAVAVNVFPLLLVHIEHNYVHTL